MSDIKSRLHNWARWIRWCNLPPGRYVCPLGRISPSGNTDLIGEKKEEPRFDIVDADEANDAILKLSVSQQAIIRAHYLQSGASVKKAYRLGVSLRTYWRELQAAEKIIERECEGKDLHLARFMA